MRNRQRGSVLATSAIVLAGLIGVAGLSVLSVQRGLGISGQQRSRTQALHAAEAGVAAAAAFLKRHIALGANWGAYVLPGCGTTSPIGGGCPVMPAEIVGNAAPPGDANNPFGATAGAWYEVALYNNVTDPGFSVGSDTDAILIIRSTGYGPDGARVALEVEVGGTATTSVDVQCAGYSQQGMSEMNSGRNDCLGTINSTDSTAVDMEALP